jgi:hypothetical protein
MMAMPFEAVKEIFCKQLLKNLIRVNARNSSARQMQVSKGSQSDFCVESQDQALKTSTGFDKV